MNFKERYSKEAVEITDPQSNDHWPYFVCPKCGMGNITRAFNRCIDCGVKLKWMCGVPEPYETARQQNDPHNLRAGNYAQSASILPVKVNALVS